MKKAIYGFIILFIGCKNESPPDLNKYVFLTHEKYIGLELGGLAGADEKCSKEALDAGLINVNEYDERKYKAWLSSRDENASQRIKGRKLDGLPFNYYTPDNVFIGTFDQILNSNLKHSIQVDATGFVEESVFSLVWTGTNYKGELADEYFTCNDWDGWDDINLGVYGKSNETNINWTNFQDGPPEACIEYLKLYCFEN